nr:hypothetical protein HUO10_005390 [Paraburkholderia busanensis]
MTTPLTVHPLLFNTTFEQIPEDEAETTRQLVEVMHEILETTSQHYQHGVRSVHAKSHGLLDGEMTVLAGLPPELAQGVFAKPGTHKVVMRLSTYPGDLLDDSVSTPRGLALKILDVDGARLPGSETGTSQDFVMVNAPAFTAATPKAFLTNLRLLAKTTDRAPTGKKILSAVLRGAEKVVEAVGGESGTLKSLGGHPDAHSRRDVLHSRAGSLWAIFRQAQRGARLCRPDCIDRCAT